MAMIDRREALGALAGGALAGGVAALSPPAHAAAARKGIRPRFLWGAATAGHQVEGNNINADIWLLEQVRPTIFAEPSGDACDSLNRWREDIALVKALGLNCYRFSVEWSRIEVAPGQFSQANLDLYRRMVDHCREQGIAPVVTIIHFTTPRWFAAAGGWAATDAPDLFARYSERVVRALGDGISHILTFNEPNGPLAEPWSLNPPTPVTRAKIAACIAAAAKASGSDRFGMLHGDPERMVPGITAGHVAARNAIRAARPGLPVGMSLALADDVAVGADSAIERKRAAVYGPFLAVMGEDDFVGVQTYERCYIGVDREVPPPAGTPRRSDGKEWFPGAVGNATRYAHRVTGKPVFITENGIGTPHDEERARFIPEAIASVEAAVRDGVPVIGYIHWSLLDNFEWQSGYGPKFGLAAVDRQSFKRTLKPSAQALRRIALADGVSRA